MDQLGTLRTGAIRVEAVGVEGRTLADCTPIVGDRPWSQVTWKGGAELGVDEGVPITLHVIMEQAKIYGLEFR